MQDYRKSNGEAPRVRSRSEDEIIIGIDGEGFDDSNGVHRYVYLAASTKHELVSELEDPKGLSTAAILEWIVSFPNTSRIFMFAAQYDWTHWMRDLSNRAVYSLWRPEERTIAPKKKGDYPRLKPIQPRVCGGRITANMLATRLTIREGQSRSRTIWDVYKFVTMSFVAALTGFDVGTKKERRQIQKMKDQRGKFRRIGPREKKYCQHETRLLAELVEKIEEDNHAIGIGLKDWFGAGSGAAAMLKQSNAQNERATTPKRMDRAIDCAFAGGRFEISECGPITPARAYDVASAHPYGETQLPCMKHGKWERVRGSHAKVLRAVERSSMACVRYELPAHEAIATVPATEADPSLEAHIELAMLAKAGKAPKVPHPGTLRVASSAWGPFPFRLEDGSILFPVTSGGGWVWKPELMAALEHPKLWPNIRIREAWVHRSRCSCPNPFLRDVARYYKWRLELGKDSGRGLLLKRYLAARTGKRSQSIGRAPFRDMVAAGFINSFCRAMTLTAIGRARDPWNVIGISTDAVFSRERLELPRPKGTGTERDAKRASRRDQSKASALGAWEHTYFPGGLFFIRPGQRFAIGSKDMKTTAARGLGVRTLHKGRAMVLEAWRKTPRQPVEIDRPAIFHGAKLCTSFSDETGVYGRSELFGQWERPKPWKVSYEPLTKRPCFDGDTNRLLTWALGPEHGTSSPYDPKKSANDPNIIELRATQDEADDQPDGGIDTMGEDV